MNRNNVKYTSFGELKGTMGLKPNLLGWNGTDHVLLHHHPVDQCALGRTLSLDWRDPFVYPGLGAFTSASNLKYWLIAKDHPDDYRTRNCNELGKIFSTGMQKNGRFVVNLNAIIIYAKYLQMRAKPLVVISQELIDTPWVMYKTLESGLREAKPAGEWYGPAIKSVYRMLADAQNGVEMDEDEEMHKIILNHRLLGEDAELPYIQSLLQEIIGNRPPPPAAPPPQEAQPSASSDPDQPLSKGAMRRMKKAAAIARAEAARARDEEIAALIQDVPDVESIQQVDQEHSAELESDQVDEQPAQDIQPDNQQG